MKRGQTIYIYKVLNGYDWMLKCKFVSYVKGIVTASVIKNMDNRDWRPSQFYGEIRAKVKSCSLVYRGKGDDWARHHWFGRDGD